MAELIDISNEKFWDILFDEACVEGQQAERIEKALKTISTTEAECERRYGYDCARNESKITIDLCKEIVQEVAKEYGKDTNVPSNGWIPCSERLPIHRGWYLVTNELGVVQQQYWGASRWQKLRDEAVIAWQPLPAPYQKGE